MDAARAAGMRGVVFADNAQALPLIEAALASEPSGAAQFSAPSRSQQ